MLDIRPADLAIVRRILARHLPGIEVRAFGSRATGKARQWSDLDLLVVTPTRLPLATLAALRDDLCESDLTIRVDVVESASPPPWLARLRADETVVVQPAV